MRRHRVRGGGALARSSRVARVLAAVGLVAVPVVGAAKVAASPALALGVVVALALALPALTSSAESDGDIRARRARALRGAASVALLGFVAGIAGGLLSNERWSLGFGLALLIADGFAVLWLATAERGVGFWVVVVGVIGSIVCAGLIRGVAGADCLALGPAIAALVAQPDDSTEGLGALSWALEHPARLVVSTFLLLCVLGALALALPLSSATPTAIGVLDAAFTSVSAVCVTGLIVLDTPNAFSGFGQLVLVLLIQVGGLGIMAFYTVALRALGRRLSLRHEVTVAGALSVEQEGKLFGAVARVLAVTFVSEALGVLLLLLAFVNAGEGFRSALWRAVFTSVSAFCNAGFALQTDSLIPYQQSPLVLHTVAGLIIAGGLSPLAIVALPALIRRRPTPLQVKLVLSVTALLLVASTVAFLSFEWSASLAHLGFGARVNNAWFQAVTLRTAGFNSVDLMESRPATRSLMMAMMFVGGSPGGTAGGIKTTTAAVLVLAVAAAMRGRTHIAAFGRHIRHTSVYKAVAVTTVGLLTCMAGVTAMQLTQDLPFDVGVFEVVSALGTVGLSLNGTSHLDEVGKVVIMVCMFMGRVGPLTLFLFLAEQRAGATWVYPDEEIDVG